MNVVFKNILIILFLFTFLGAFIQSDEIGVTYKISEIGLLEKKCENKNYEACFFLGNYYDDKNDTLAQKYLKSACSHIPSACHNLALIYYKLGKNNKTYDLLLKSCEKNVSRSCFLIGYIARNINDKKRVYYLDKSCKLKNDHACSILFDYKQKGKFYDPNALEKIVKKLEKKDTPAEKLEVHKELEKEAYKMIINDRKFYSDLYWNISYNYMKLGKYNKAMSYIKKFLKFSSKIANFQNFAIGGLFMEFELYEKSIQFTKKCYYGYKENEFYKYACAFNLVMTYLKLKEYEKMYDWLEKSLNNKFKDSIINNIKNSKDFDLNKIKETNRFKKVIRKF